MKHSSSSSDTLHNDPQKPPEEIYLTHSAYFTKCHVDTTLHYKIIINRHLFLSVSKLYTPPSVYSLEGYIYTFML